MEPLVVANAGVVEAEEGALALSARQLQLRVLDLELKSYSDGDDRVGELLSSALLGLEVAVCCANDDETAAAHPQFAVDLALHRLLHERHVPRRALAVLLSEHRLLCPQLLQLSGGSNACDGVHDEEAEEAVEGNGERDRGERGDAGHLVGHDHRHLQLVLEIRHAKLEADAAAQVHADVEADRGVGGDRVGGADRAPALRAHAQVDRH
mmetsp:Transcript_7271/g.30921  ORF Transcript_7271/g.30921 Transcript_7271/m.30921 type:complete len:209 (-) Transcript_7271:965-1591(-)